MGQLPSARSDLAAERVGGRVFLIGGYDGTRLSADVLSTPDGRAFQVTTKLSEPVRYGAVAAVGQTIFVFGGEPSAGGETDAIQAIDTCSGNARVVGRLPVPSKENGLVT